MPLILAIEPDRRQASRVTALTRGALGADLVVADSTEHGVAALEGRVPDLILTSRLLSPKDEAGLRAFHRSGVPVPTLMIPVLAAASHMQQERTGGLLARLSRSRPASAFGGDGCDPEVFASQIAEYLAEVHEVQRVHQAQAVPDAPEVQPVHEPDEALEVHEVLEVLEVSSAPEIREIEEEVAGIAAMTAVHDAEVVEEPVVEVTASAAFEWEEIVLIDEDDTIELSSEAIDLQAFVDELNATYADLFPKGGEQEVEFADVPAVVAASHAPAAPRLTLSQPLPMRASWPVLEGIAADETPLADITEVVADFAAALDDAEDEPDNPGQGDADSDLWMPLSTMAFASWPRLDSTCSRARAAQDEWGFFDPEQCGFSALVAKLDQMTR